MPLGGVHQKLDAFLDGCLPLLLGISGCGSVLRLSIVQLKPETNLVHLVRMCHLLETGHTEVKVLQERKKGESKLIEAVH